MEFYIPQSAIRSSHSPSLLLVSQIVVHRCGDHTLRMESMLMTKCDRVYRPVVLLAGDHTVVETPVPIPNTVVKHPGPMIVPTSAKVGIARFFKLQTPPDFVPERGFLRLN